MAKGYLGLEDSSSSSTLNQMQILKWNGWAGCLVRFSLREKSI